MNEQSRAGMLSIFIAYLIWGLFPIYWKLIEHVAAYEILANRIIWSFVFVVIFILLTRNIRKVRTAVLSLIEKPKQAIVLTAASLLISCNWFLYIWAVTHDRVIETSLGYYINPLMSVLLGVFILKESLSRAQVFSVILAAAGVLVLTVSYGQLPWVSLGLAVTFALYGLMKKTIQLEAASGLMLETLIVTPAAVLFLIYLSSKEQLALFSVSTATDLLLIAGGAVTALPLLLFAEGAPKIPLSMIGILQYITPTMTLFLGLFAYHEPFSSVQLLAFAFIWTALIVFTLSQTKWFQKKQSFIERH
ncbi:EamA family transporter RarD [Bacillus thermotolerans]|uniref:EamA family transporter RarD n=1 Tax=Bacillus thermotolerans TaxID=1221996 RepID=UPI00057CDF74|nr:EamA family transporter RarD [Bacillus thermotolerans]KKB37576.1 Protein rarD [Bacillus thermotolerans]